MASQTPDLGSFPGVMTGTQPGTSPTDGHQREAWVLPCGSPGRLLTSLPAVPAWLLGDTPCHAPGAQFEGRPLDQVTLCSFASQEHAPERAPRGMQVFMPPKSLVCRGQES